MASACGSRVLHVVNLGVSIAGPWRWFDDSMLDCCEPLAKIKADGITFGKVACLAHCNGAKVEAFRTSESTIDDFRKYVICCTSSEDCHVITSYHRAVFKQVLWAYLNCCLLTSNASLLLHSLFFRILSEKLLCPWKWFTPIE